MPTPAAEAGSSYHLLHEVAARVHSSLTDLPATLDAVACGVVEATCFGAAVVNLVTTSGDLEVVSVRGDDEARAALLGVVERADHWAELIDSGQEWGTLRFIPHDSPLQAIGNMQAWIPPSPAADDTDGGELWDPKDTLLAPLYSSGGHLIGALSVDLPDGGRRPQADQLQLLELFAAHASLAIEHAHLHHQLLLSREELRHAANHDGLTGLLNRSGLLAAAAEQQSPMAVLVLDLDGFKAVNDTFGHRTGDAVLVAVGERLRSHLGSGDVLARTGGDEYVIITTGAGAGPDALRTLRGVLTDAIALPIVTEAGSHLVQVSVGCARADEPGQFERLLAEADARMYEAKRPS